MALWVAIVLGLQLCEKWGQEHQNDFDYWYSATHIKQQSASALPAKYRDGKIEKVSMLAFPDQSNDCMLLEIIWRM